MRARVKKGLILTEAELVSVRVQNMVRASCLNCNNNRIYFIFELRKYFSTLLFSSGERLQCYREAVLIILITFHLLLFSIPFSIETLQSQSCKMILKG